MDEKMRRRLYNWRVSLREALGKRREKKNDV